ncbi:MAG TPA: sigma-70 family RNA polymerase sigma factor [Gemmataceae bacterium]|nr:sigma-70 family RNA polymerase sigma factor [Gemmataceae bacterium]
MRLVGNADGAREVVQETFLRALQFRHSFNGHARYSTWLYRIAVNTVITAKRKQSRERRLDIYAGEGYRLDIPDASGALQPSHALERAEEKRRLHAALKQLSIEHSMVLVMKDMEGWSYEEISKALDLPIGTIRSRLSRARLKLRKLLIEERPK